MALSILILFGFIVFYTLGFYHGRSERDVAQQPDPTPPPTSPVQRPLPSHHVTVETYPWRPTDAPTPIEQVRADHDRRVHDRSVDKALRDRILWPVEKLN